MIDKPLRDTWVMFQREHHCSIDKMLCSPDLRNEFIDAAKLATGVDDENTLLWTLVGLRKKKLLSSNLK